MGTSFRATIAANVVRDAVPGQRLHGRAPWSAQRVSAERLRIDQGGDGPTRR